MKSNKLIAIGLAAAMVCSCFFGVNVYAGEVQESENEVFYEENFEGTKLSDEGYEYETLEDGTLEITRYTGTDTQITIPSELDGKTVAIIGYNAFTFCSNLTSITLSANVRIRDASSAFWGCSSLEEIIVDGDHPRYFSQDGILYLKSEVGNWITLLFCPQGKSGSIVIPDSVNEISASAFQGCSKLTGITIPNHISDIKEAVFSGCSSLESFVIPENVWWIYDNAFMNCSSLKSITIPKRVSFISGNVFSGCSSLEEIKVEDGNTGYMSKDGILYGLDNQMNVHTLDCCPAGKTGSIVVSDPIEWVGEEAFSGCIGVTDITLPAGVKELENGAFSGCSGLLNITIPEGITDIGTDAFYGCSSLVSVTLPQGISEMNQNLFSGCSSLTDIDIPKGVMQIDSQAFYGCSSLNNVMIPSGVAELEGGVFEQCSNLTTITLPASVTVIGEDTFEGDKNINLNVISGSYAEEYAKEYGIKYTALEGKQDGAYRYEELEDGSIEIIGYTGMDASVIIPSEIGGKKVLHIGTSAFRNCRSLNNITIPEGVISIGNGAFYGCENLNSVTMPKQITSIGRKAFYGCSSLESVTIPEDTVSIGEYTFKDCSSLNFVKISKNVQYIGDWTFSGCSSDLTVLVTAGSYAEEYAKAWGYSIKYESVSEDQDNADSGMKPNPFCTHIWTSTVTPAKVNVNGSIQTKCTKCGTIQNTTILYAPASITLSQTEYTYNGKEQKPIVTIKDSNQKTLMNQTDYTVVYPDGMKNVGKYTVKVQFKGNYSGTMEQDFIIIPKSTSIIKITAKKKGFSIKWKKQAGQITGYEISYSTDSKFKAGVSKPIVIKKVKITSKTVNKLKPKKKYYVRIRTFKKVNGAKIYSEWSKSKTVKIKK